MWAKSFRVGVGVGVIVGMSWAIPACSDDDNEGSGGSSGSGGASGSGGSGTGGSGTGGSGTGGSAGGTGTGGSGTGGTGGAGDGGQTIDCAGTSCPALAGVGCCAGTAGDKCGIDVSGFVDGGASCLETNQPGDPDPACDLTVDAGAFDGGIDGGFDGGGFDVPGCCRPDGTCGVIFETGVPGLDLGCISPSDFGSTAPPRTCTP